MRAFGLNAPGLGEEGDAEGLDKTSGRQRARQRQQRAADGKDQTRQTSRGAKTLKQRLVGEPFADEAIERRQRGNGHRADEKEKCRPRHSLYQAAEFLHVACVSRVLYRAGPEEEQSLEQGVIDRVVQPGNERHSPQQRVVGMLEHQRCAEHVVEHGRHDAERRARHLPRRRESPAGSRAPPAALLEK